MGFFLELDGCCCCCRLRTGSLVLLWITVVIPLLSFLPLMLFLPAMVYASASEKNKDVPVGGVLTLLAILSTVLLIIVAPPAAALYGIYKKKPSFMFPVIVLNVIGIIISILSLIGQIVMTVNGDLKQQNPAALIIFSILQLLIGWYFSSVIYSYYSRLKNEVKPVAYGERA